MNNLCSSLVNFVNVEVKGVLFYVCGKIVKFSLVKQKSEIKIRNELREVLIMFVFC